jgi:hypothetical protein
LRLPVGFSGWREEYEHCRVAGLDWYRP